MTFELYKPERVVTGPAYTAIFKVLATVVTLVLAGYGLSFALRFPLLQYSFGVKMLLLGAAFMMGISYYWFLRSTVTIDDKGITQTWLYNRQVEWPQIRSVKLIGIPGFGWLFPPRLVISTGNSYTTFNGGTQALLVEFAKISLAFQMKK